VSARKSVAPRRDLPWRFEEAALRRPEAEPGPVPPSLRDLDRDHDGVEPSQYVVPWRLLSIAHMGMVDGRQAARRALARLRGGA
jgi:hypothetical protein